MISATWSNHIETPENRDDDGEDDDKAKRTHPFSIITETGDVLRFGYCSPYEESS